MRDEEDTIMYVGKAKNLHNRVRSYFVEKISGRGPQIAQMAALVSRFEYIVVDSEMEALILENNLIKENRPRYNTLLKDDKTYPFIKVTVGEKYPRVLFSRVQKRDSSKYFGPYPSAQAVRDTIDLINRLCELRTCSRQRKSLYIFSYVNVLFSLRERPRDRRGIFGQGGKSDKNPVGKRQGDNSGASRQNGKGIRRNAL